MSNSPRPVRQIAVVGCGNPWRRDDGLGIAAVQQLAVGLAGKRCQAVKPRGAAFAAFEMETAAGTTNVQLIETDRPAQIVLDCLARVDIAIILDALMAGGPPGTIYRLAGAELAAAVDHAKSGAANLGLSYHDTDVLGALALARAVCPEQLPRAITIWGIEPRSLEMEQGLTPRVATSVPKLVAGVRAELNSMPRR